jgi:hypothetical protein
MRAPKGSKEARKRDSGFKKVMGHEWVKDPSSQEEGCCCQEGSKVFNASPSPTIIQ